MALDAILSFLGCATPESWLEAAPRHLPVLLLDHKNCEWKAAATAFNLMGRHSTKLDLVNKLSRLAREELVHMEQVLRIMKRRGIPVTTLSASRYASALREAVSTAEPQRLVDTLVVGAFIEARSCERFAALAPRLDEELGKFYTGLLNSEARHYQDYLRLAHRYAEGVDLEAAVQRFRVLEAELIQSPDLSFRFHSGCPLAEAA